MFAAQVVSSLLWQLRHVGNWRQAGRAREWGRVDASCDPSPAASNRKHPARCVQAEQSAAYLLLTDSNALNLFGLTLKQTIATYRSGESLGMTSLASWEVPMPEIPTAVPPAPTSERSGRRVRNMDSDDGKENQLGCRPDLELTLISAWNLLIKSAHTVPYTRYPWVQVE